MQPLRFGRHFVPFVISSLAILAKVRPACSRSRHPHLPPTHCVLSTVCLRADKPYSRSALRVLTSRCWNHLYLDPPYRCRSSAFALCEWPNDTVVSVTLTPSANWNSSMLSSVDLTVSAFGVDKGWCFEISSESTGVEFRRVAEGDKRIMPRRDNLCPRRLAT